MCSRTLLAASDVGSLFPHSTPQSNKLVEKPQRVIRTIKKKSTWLLQWACACPGVDILSMLSLPTTSCGDAAVVCGGLSPLLEPTLVLLLTATQQVEAEDDEDAADAGAASAAASKRRARGKADLRMELGKNDPYALLELDHLRWRATADDVRKSYRRLVLLHHPDKKVATAEEGAPDAEEDDEMFKAISDAFELLSTPKKRRESRLPETRSTRRREKAPQTRRREFDSLDEFDDTVPTADDAAAGGFFGTFGPVFERNSRWSERGEM